MICAQCNQEFESKNKKAKFCSAKCKVDSQKGKRENLDSTINIRCKIDGKIFADYSNRSGNLTLHSKKILLKEFDWNDWEQISVELPETWNCPYCNWASVDLKNKSGWITTHLEKEHNLTPEEHCNEFPEDSKMWKMYWIYKERRQELMEDYNRVQCQECGEWMKVITNSHLKMHGLTEREYKKKYDVDYLHSDSVREKFSKMYHENLALQESNAWQSKYELEIINFLKTKNINVYPTFKELGFEIDIYLPDFKLGIEFNGLYSHSQYACGKLQYYHLNKTKLSEKNGIHLIHIFEDEWLKSKEIIKSRILNLIGLLDKKIYARQCTVESLDYQDTKKFLNQNHLQGTITSGNIRLGLFYENELVSAMVLGGLGAEKGYKIKNEGEFELKRFCSKLGYNVIGAANKLLSFFEKEYHPVSVISFANRNWTSLLKKSVYEQMGFTLIKETEPNYWYLVEPDVRSYRFNFTKSKILQMFKDADPNLSEWENMIKLGFDRIWDTGSLKYQKVYDSRTLELIKPNSEMKISVREQRTKHRKRPNHKKSNRNIPDIICKICENSIPIVGMQKHLQLQHSITINEYVIKYGEYRPKEIRRQKLLEEVGDKYKCLSCEERMVSHKQLVQHINSKHESFEKYVIEFIFGGEFPTCKCGCGNPVKIKSQPPYRTDYISGHNANGMEGKLHSKETRRKQKEKAEGRFSLEWFIGRYGLDLGTKKYEDRCKSLSERNKRWYSNKK